MYHNVSYRSKSLFDYIHEHQQNVFTDCQQSATALLMRLKSSLYTMKVYSSSIMSGNNETIKTTCCIQVHLGFLSII